MRGLTARSTTFAGVALMFLSWAAFSLQDAIVKALVVNLPVVEVLFARSILIVVFAACGASRFELSSIFKRPAAEIILIRSALIVLAWLTYYTASRSLQLAELVTFYFAAPLFVVALSRPMLGEFVGLGRWLATLAGFCGVVVAANPSNAPSLLPAGLALVAALSWGMTSILARKAANSVNTSAMLIGSNATFAVICLFPAPWLFARPDARALVLMLALGVVGGLGQYFWFEGVRRAQVSLLAPLEYSMLAFAVLWGWSFFGDWPDSRTLIGAGMVLVSGTASLLLETRRGRETAEASSLPSPLGPTNPAIGGDCEV